MAYDTTGELDMVYENVPDTFKSFAEAYDYFSRSNAYNEFYERPAIRDLLPENLQGLRVLDAGCAGGLHAQWMVERGANVLLIDRDPDMVAIASSRLGNGGVVVQADLTEPLGFVSSASIDLVFCSLTMHYIENWQPTLAEFHRVLVKGGQLLISTHHPCADSAWGGSDYFAVELLTQTWNEFGKQSYEVTFFRRPLSAIVADLSETGFRIESLIEPRHR